LDVKKNSPHKREDIKFTIINIFFLMENLSARNPHTRGKIIVEKVLRDAIAPISNPENPIL